jgi:hypothetical protein
LIQQAEPTTGKQNHRQVLRNHAIVAITIHWIGVLTSFYEHKGNKDWRIKSPFLLFSV